MSIKNYKLHHSQFDQIASEILENIETTEKELRLAQTHLEDKQADFNSKVDKNLDVKKFKASYKKPTSPKPDKNNFLAGIFNFFFGMVLILGASVIVGGAISYYTNDGAISRLLNESQSGSLKSGMISNLNLPQPNSQLVKTDLPNSIPPQLSQQPLANKQNLTLSQELSNLNPTQEQLPDSCNGQRPVLKAPLNLKNADDRNILYCILDIESLEAQKQTDLNQLRQLNPSSIPQR